MKPFLSVLPWQPLFEHQQNILCLLSSENTSSWEPRNATTTKVLEGEEAGGREGTSLAGATIPTEQILPAPSPSSQCSSPHVSAAFLIPAGPLWVPLAFKPMALSSGRGWCPVSCGWRCARQSQILLVFGSFSMSPDQKVLKPGNCE